MYPDLSYLFHDLFGTDVDNFFSIFKSFGLMLGLAFLCCGILLKSELKRLQEEGKLKPIKFLDKSNVISNNDIVVNALITAAIGAKLPYIIQNFDVFKGDPASVIFSKLGNWPLGLFVGLLYAAFLYYRKTKTENTKPVERMLSPHEKTVDIIFLAAVSGIAGGRLFSILENFGDFLRDPFGQFFSGSGLTVYGGIITAFIVVYWYIKKLGIKPLYMMDIAGMGILLGYAVGRMGCQIAGDGDWGIVAQAQPDWWCLPDWIWSFNYPNNVNNDGVLMSGVDPEVFRSTVGTVEEKCKAASGMRYCHELDPKVYPTPIYEIVASFIGLGILWALRRKIKVAGTIFSLYLIFNGVERFFVEQIRVNERYNYFGLDWSQAQYISVGFILLGIAGLLYLYKFRKNNPAT